MPNYAIRVELKGNPSYVEYEKLHTAMANLGFNRTIVGTSTNGQQATWDLPHALYYGFSNDAINTLRDNAVKAAQRIQSGVIVFVGQVETWAIGNYS